MPDKRYRSLSWWVAGAVAVAAGLAWLGPAAHAATDSAFAGERGGGQR